MPTDLQHEVAYGIETDSTRATPMPTDLQHEVAYGIETDSTRATPMPTTAYHPAPSVPPTYSASCWYAIDWKLMRCSGDTPIFSIAARCSGVEYPTCVANSQPG
jgi:hypothetical protein